jgi:putative ABC transport system substrate-binding protein
MIGRRALVVGLGSATTMWPGAARAQQKAMPLIGILGASFPDDPAVTLNLAAFRQALSEAGFVEGRNVAIEYRWAQRHSDRLPSLAAELVTDGVDVIVTEGGDASSLAAKNATSAIPVVFHTVSDPVAMGIVASLARPGGNLTGVNLLTTELFPKLLQLIHVALTLASASLSWRNKTTALMRPARSWCVFARPGSRKLAGCGSEAKRGSRCN